MGTNELTYPDATGLEVTEISGAEVRMSAVDVLAVLDAVIDGECMDQDAMLIKVRATVAELIEAASDPDVSFRRMSGVQYSDPSKGDRARARLRAALARVQVAQS